ncbi:MULTISPECIES: undecaprenyl-phosphate galactose phosphotransferase WbaP [unclassified Janthinobacterium]|uniref:undecaprenyl-phosphate galactose phosphotransferase WbaP n=1 Tax=unclassified Janthinobacterium TaxID=2610881 RepID=UPI00160D03F3|nr:MULTISPECIES: undecaprenyl-phosphate galactose phosphotransferase WbaP [unclassified Janthinobacterium]MBB5608611.1 undecaprenyl-phosphate galactose phosphotransferase [Janthinobacterium sp. S3T4]MBB5614132.1 undecaprenyl-phosphate galactose phosphotransferase [Janthinobacterium sp. S3M3]
MKPVEGIFIQEVKWYCSSVAEKYFLTIADAMALFAAFCLAGIMALHRSELNTWGLDSSRLLSFFLLSLVALALFKLKGHHAKRRPYSNEIREVLKIVLIMGLIDASLIFLGKRNSSRAALLMTWLLAPCLVLLLRGMVKFLLLKLGGWIRPMVIIGWGENALQTARAFDEEALMGYRLIAFLIPEGQECFEHQYLNRGKQPVPCISLGPDPEQTLKMLGDPHAVVALEQGGIDTYQGMIQQVSRRVANMQVVPAVRGLPLYGMEVNHFFTHEVLLLTMRNNLARPGLQLIKRCFDLTTSIAVMIIGSPVLLWIAAKVLASGRPIFYGHKRVGQNGKHFLCYKFRTMAVNADVLLKELLERDPQARAEWDRDFKLKNDPRITSIGHFLRKTSLDELPQLWNVLKGEMSLVGPRPIVDAELERYGNQVDYYLEAKPGVTGLWQVSGRNDVSYDTRVYLDAWYVKNWSLFNDIVILLKTVKVIFKKDGAY